MRPLRHSIVPRINITPLVDVVLVLLIIFMVISPLLQKGREVELPRAEPRENQPTGPGVLTVTVTVDGVIALDDELVSSAELRTRVGNVLRQNPTVDFCLKGDARLPYKNVRDVMNILIDAGISSLSLAIREAP
jgi:biopolymer transport protein ExbD